MIARLSMLLVMSMALPAVAQQPSPTVEPKPELIIGGQPPPIRTFERCVDVEIGGARSYGCLNETLRRDVDKVAPSLNLPPIDARSSDTRLGIVNIPAVQQQYGSNFGRSVMPFRMPQPVFGTTPRQ
ncbi:hypothetical protein [Tardiphaga sp.]|jgi:hypothetical protein|uniref:hypothetical protein n=1 Tax=Tardiphaga sp. TaxID=1926292 RepID=UPI0037DA698D